MESSISGMINKLFMSLQTINKRQSVSLSLTQSQIRIMMFIGRRLEEGKKTFQRDIEREFNLKGSSVTSILNNLERNKWIMRESVKEDARLKSIVFAERSAAVIEYMKILSGKFDSYMKSSLTEAEFIVFCQCVDKMHKALEENKDILIKELEKMNADLELAVL